MKRYFVWKDGKYNGKETEWDEISESEYEDIRENEPGRRFNQSFDENDFEADHFYYEVSDEEYKEWNRERMRFARHDRNVYGKNTVVHFEDLVDEDDSEGLIWADVIPDTSEEDAETHEAWENWHEKALEALREALSELKPKELETVNLVFLNNTDEKKETVLAKENNMPQQTLNYRKNAVLKKLRRIMVEKLGRN